MLQQRSFCVALLAASVPVGTAHAQAVSITVESRDSFASVNAFAGSNGATSSDSNSLSEQMLLGAFSFGDTVSADIDLSDPLSQGIAQSEATIGVSDVVLLTGATLNITALKQGEVSAMSIAAPSSATATATYNQTVRFRVEGADFNYNLSGSFDPGDAGVTNPNTGRLLLSRPSTGIDLFNITDAGTLDESGVLRDGLVYELSVRSTDDYEVDGGSSSTDASSLNLFFNVSPVTCPLSADLSGDCDVDDQDLGLFFSAFTGPDQSQGPLSNPIADLSGDADVDDEDLGEAFAQFTGPLGPAVVPEPASAAGVAMLGLILGTRRRGRLLSV